MCQLGIGMMSGEAGMVSGDVSDVSGLAGAAVEMRAGCLVAALVEVESD